MGAKLAKNAEAVRGPVKAARSSSRFRGLKGLAPTAADADLDDDGEETFQDMTGKRRFESLYALGTKLGAGTYAEVYRCTHRRTRKERAVKVVMLDRLTHADDLRALEEEIEILSTLRHNNIVRLYHVFREEGRVYLIQEICAGGELFDRIVAKRNYCENDARELMRRALQALAYAHGQGVVHRDLKPENILLASPHDDVELKLADFGMARCLSPKLDCLSTICGSPGYMAPEIITQQPYDEKVDIWSLGTICFALLGGYNPWDDRSTAMVFAKIKRGKYRFDGAAFQAVSEDAKDLIKHMLVASPAKRISARACLEHNWFLVNESTLMQHKLTLTQSELREMRKNARFRRAANAVMVANRFKVLSSGRSLSGTTSSSGASASSLSRSGHGGSGSDSDSCRGVSSLSSSSCGESKHMEDAGSSKGSGDSLGRSGSARSRSSSATLEGGSLAAVNYHGYHGGSSGSGSSNINDGVMQRGPSAAGSGASRVSAPSSPTTVPTGQASLKQVGDATIAKAAADWAASCTPPGTRSGGTAHGKTVSFGYNDRREDVELDKRRHAGMASEEEEELKVNTDTWM